MIIARGEAGGDGAAGAGGWGRGAVGVCVAAVGADRRGGGGAERHQRGADADVDDPSTPGALIDAPGAIEIAGSSTSWYRVTGTTAQIYMEEVCHGVRTRLDWFSLTPDGAGGLMVQVSAQSLVPGAFSQVVRQLPTPVPHIGPADEHEDGYAYVNTPMIVWVDEGPGQWATVSGTASAGGVSVTVQAEPVRLVVDPGDGAEPVRCSSFRPVLRRDVGPGDEFPPDGSCSYVYRDSSAMAPNGETWPVAVSIVWHASWSSNTGQGGDLGFVTTDAPIRDLPVAEIQAVIVDTHSD